MASSLHLLIQVQPFPNFPSITAPLFPQKPFHIPSLTSLKPSNKPLFPKPLTVPFALTESSDSPNSLQPNNNAQSLLQQLADCFDLPQDYFSQLPSDLRIDLNDAAFDLSNGPVIDECGQVLGDTLLNLSQAWELADTSASHSLASKLPGLEESLTDNAKSAGLALGKCLVSAGRRFQSMGQYGQGELQKGVQSIPESSLQYANDNALLLAKSLRGALLAICYSSAVLSAFSTVGLVLLGRQLDSKE